MGENKILITSSSAPTPSGVASTSDITPGSSICQNRLYALASQ